MGTFNDGDSGSSIRTKLNTAIEKTEGTSAISTIDVDGGAIDGVTIGTNSAVTDLRVDNLQLDGNTVSSTNLNGDVTIDPNGTGDVNIGNFKFDADQTVGAGQDNYVLTYDNAGGKISLEAAAGGGGGAWNLISTTTVSVATASVAFTSIGSYNRYVLLWDCTMSSQQIPKMQIYDNGVLQTGSDYAMMRNNVSSGGSFQTTHSGWIGASGATSQIGRFDISIAAPRATMEMAYGGFDSTTDAANLQLIAGGMKSTYSITSIDGFNFTTTAGTAVINSGRFSLYGLSQ
jgi:hypothetical protein